MVAMTVALDVEPSGDVAVLRGVADEGTLLHLCRSLIAGSVFDVYRALVIDLQGRELSSAAVEAIADATQACLRRRQWLGVATGGLDAAGAIADARKWLDLVDRPSSGLRDAVLRVVRGLT